MKLLRFEDLKARGIVQYRSTVAAWQKTRGFPKQFRIGANTAVWREDEVNAWLAQQEAARERA